MEHGLELLQLVNVSQSFTHYAFGKSYIIGKAINFNEKIAVTVT